jgi:hypothetical protein
MTQPLVELSPYRFYSYSVLARAISRNLHLPSFDPSQNQNKKSMCHFMGRGLIFTIVKMENSYNMGGN